MNQNNEDILEAYKIRRNFRLIAIAAVVTIIFGSIVMHVIEKWDWVDSVYFSVVSLTTVGYGDLTPTTELGKIFVIIYLLIGVGIITALASNLLRNVKARHVIKISKKQ